MEFVKYAILGLVMGFYAHTTHAQTGYFEPNMGQISLSDDNSSNPPIAVFHHPLGQVYVCEDRLRIKLTNTADKPLIHQSFHYKNTDSAFTIRYQVFDIIFDQSQTPTKILFENPAPYYLNYYLGNDPQSWKTNVYPSQSITLKNIYPHTDLRIYTQNGGVEFDWILRPGANAEHVKLQFSGQQKLLLSKNALTLKGEHAQCTLSSPKAYTTRRGEKHPQKPIACRYSKLGKNSVMLQLGNRDTNDTIVIDPVLVFSTYSGSTADNFGFTATYDNQGCLYAGGIVDASSRAYPVTTGAFQTTYGGSNNGAEPVFLPCDISISKYSPNGNSLLYATYLGGSNNEYPHSLATDLQGNLLLLGSTVSTNYPVYRDSAIQTTNAGGYDIVLTKFTPDGKSLLGSTYFGGAFNDGFQTNNGGRRSELVFNYADNYRGDITTDAAGNVYVATCTQSENINIPTNAYQQNIGGATDALVFSTSPNFSKIRWMSYFGGTNDDAAYSCRLDENGSVFIGGGTASDNFPIEGPKPYSNTYKQAIDGFIMKLNTLNGAYTAGTFWGNWGIPPEPVAYDQIYFVDIDPDGNVYFTGQTTGNITRSPNCYGQDNAGQMIGRFNNNLDSLQFITTFGNSNRGNPDLSPTAFMVDDCYNIYFSGWGSFIGVGNAGTTVDLEITPDAHQKTTDGNDFYLLALSRNAENILYASYFGGNQSEDHVDGGTSRFDKRGIVYQSVCASCPDQPPGLNDFPTTPNAAFTSNVSIRCSNASFKLDFRLGYSVDAEFLTTQTRCLNQESRFNPINRHNAQYFWDFGDGDTSQQFSPTHTYKDTGTYKVELRVVDTQSCNVFASRTQIIRVILAPKASFTFATNPCVEETLFQANGVHFDSITWDFGDGSAPKYNENPIAHTFPKGTFTTTAIFSNSLTGCIDTVKLNISDTSDTPPELNLSNTFTPNNDGFNDCFRVYGFSDICEKGEIRIYNRWGAKVYQSKRLGSFCWNGQVDNQGEYLPSGTYFYIIDIIESQNPKLPKKINGTVQLIRNRN